LLESGYSDGRPCTAEFVKHWSGWTAILAGGFERSS
jgi:hypothetical protein